MGGSIDPPYKSDPSTSEDKNADLSLLGFYKAAGVGAPDHRGVGWTVRCDLSGAMSETTALDLKNLISWILTSDVRKWSNFRESIGCISYYPSVYFLQTIQSH